MGGNTMGHGKRLCSFELLLALGVVVAAGCGDPPVQEGLTGIDLTVTHATEIDQVEISVLAGTEIIVSGEPVPEPPRALERTGEGIAILLAEGLAGSTLTVRVIGLSEGAPVASGAEEVLVVVAELVPVTVRLGEPAECGDGDVAVGLEECDDGNTTDDDGCSSACEVDPGWSCTTPDDGPSVCGTSCGGDDGCEPGQRCVGDMCVCDDVSCPGGCCDGASCEMRSFETCGASGSTCVVCDAMLASSCSAEGACVCGVGAVCAPGQRCLSGACFCDGESCPDGCCEEGVCLPASLEACGVAGGSCAACDASAADRCSDSGECVCGDGPPCGAGARCVDGSCLCDDVSCPDGCCDGAACESLSMATCGAPGETCARCDGETSDTCSSAGECRCGSGAACAAGERCEGGACVCDGSSCEGCCQDGHCLSGDDVAACGSGGAACESCPSPQTCDLGACSGCNATTCAGGCCSGATCNPAGFDTCGVAGAPCVTCDPDRADACSATGECACGAGGECEAGQRCVAGACVCDGTSCPDGCCEGTTCQATALDTCGTAGGACVACDPAFADACSATGECECGGAAECAAGQRCVGGACLCDAVSCPDGCCSFGVCEASSFATCGIGGAACVACSADGADVCSAAGVCACGGGAECDPGQRCDAGSCVCDSLSCAGCCSGDVCEPGTTSAACGTGGGACSACPATETCIGGSCSGCDALSCPDGCCSGSTCQSPSLSTCGIGGAACVACDPSRADGCDGVGSCACGFGPPCDPGQRCSGGACVCDATSCPSGCCEGADCMTPSLDHCGTVGGACVPCDTVATDRCNADGQCRCGARAPCALPRVCVSGGCSLP